MQQGNRIGLTDVYRLPGIVIEQVAGAFPELVEQAAEIERVVKAEEARFGETLERGLKVFDELAGKDAISGEDAFTLAATYGFPLELTVELAEERGQPVDVDDYRARMAEHRTISRAGGESDTQRAADFARASDPTTFVGYHKTDVLTELHAYEDLGDGTFLAKLRETPFYAAGGGQVSDQGVIELDGDPAIRARARAGAPRRRRPGARLPRPGFAAGSRVRALVPWSVRFPTMANHTATHLLQEALREVLGDHVKQAGSAVRPDKLRFDFTHDQQLTRRGARADRAPRQPGDLREPPAAHLRDADRRGPQARRDDALRREVRRHRPGRRDRGRLARALRRHARALDGRDRVVRDPLRGLGRLRRAPDRGRHLGRGVGAAPRPLARARRRPRRARGDPQGAQAQACAGRAAAGEVEAVVRPENGFNLIVQSVEGLDGDALLDLSDRFKQRHAPAAVVLGGVDDGKVTLIANFDDAVAERVSASDVVKGAAALVGGGGGGRRTMARAGGKEPERLPEALAEAERMILAAIWARRAGPRARLRRRPHRRRRLRRERHARPPRLRRPEGGDRERASPRSPGSSPSSRRSTSSSGCR